MKRWPLRAAVILGISLLFALILALNPPERVNVVVAECKSAHQKIDSGSMKTILARHRNWLSTQSQNAQSADSNTDQNEIAERAILCNVDLDNLDLQNAELSFADLRGARIYYADFRGAKLVGANLTGARIRGANFAGTRLDRANLYGAVYEPVIGGVPDIQGASDADGLESLVWDTSPGAITELQTAFRNAGLREQERRLIYAKKKSEFSTRRPAWIYFYDRTYDAAQLGTPNSFEKWFNVILFDWTSRYGLSPGRPLFILGATIPIFSVFYVMALSGNGSGAIWKTWPPTKEQLPPDSAPHEPEKLHYSGFKAIPIALYFSLLSAFNIGWRELNVGNWISRLQPQDYSLKATGWTRVVCGFQSLLGVYLVAIWILSYFGRPFD